MCRTLVMFALAVLAAGCSKTGAWATSSINTPVREDPLQETALARAARDFPKCPRQQMRVGPRFEGSMDTVRVFACGAEALYDCPEQSPGRGLPPYRTCAPAAQLTVASVRAGPKR
jgi:hypothetical protein